MAHAWSADGAPTLSTEQERQAATATVARLTSMGVAYDAAAEVGRKVLGDVLVELGFCDRDTVEAAAREARRRGLPLGQQLVECYALPSRQLAMAIAERFALPYVRPAEFALDGAVLDLLPVAVWRRLEAVPVRFTATDELLVVVCDPRNHRALDELATLLERGIRPAVVTREDLDELLCRVARRGAPPLGRKLALHVGERDPLERGTPGART